MPDPSGRRPGAKRPPVNVEATRLESDEEIRQAILARQARHQGKAPAAGAAVPVAAPAEPDTPAETPQQRPRLAMLCVLDDGKHDGEWVRLRAERYLIGRADGDIRIPHDVLMSSRHAEIVRQPTRDGHRWVLVDLDSTNGTWVRIGGTALRPDNELLVGRGQYRFEAGAAPADEPASPADGTRAWGGVGITALVPSLVEVTPAGPGPRVPLTQAEYWIGRDPRACAIARPDDPFVNPRHARLFRDAKGQWHVENNRSVNGLWLRVDEIPLGTTCQLRMGEQRFLFRVL
jgi:pSer/pThr/pTyr-binding forkhead associated (FHA) protein